MSFINKARIAALSALILGLTAAPAVHADILKQGPVTFMAIGAISVGQFSNFPAAFVLIGTDTTYIVAYDSLVDILVNAYMNGKPVQVNLNPSAEVIGVNLQ